MTKEQNVSLNIGKQKYTATCEHCKKETAIGYDEWLNLTNVMLTFSGLSVEQKETVLLIMDGLKYRRLKDKGL